MGKPSEDDEVAAMIRQARSYFDQLERDWIEAPDYASGLARVELPYKNGQNCMRIALDGAKRLVAKEGGRSA